MDMRSGCQRFVQDTIPRWWCWITTRHRMSHTRTISVFVGGQSPHFQDEIFIHCDCEKGRFAEGKGGEG